MTTPQIKITRLYDDSVIDWLNNYTLSLKINSFTSSDGFSITDINSIQLPPKTIGYVGTGLIVDLDESVIGILANNNELVAEKKIVVAGSPIIDYTHTGELMVPIMNMSDCREVIYIGESICKLYITKSSPSEFNIGPHSQVNSKIVRNLIGYDDIHINKLLKKYNVDITEISNKGGIDLIVFKCENCITDLGFYNPYEYENIGEEIPIELIHVVRISKEDCENHSIPPIPLYKLKNI